MLLSREEERENRATMTRMHERGILIHMRTTLNIDDELLEEAQRLSGMREKTAVVRAGLEALIARESARRLAAAGATATLQRCSIGPKSGVIPSSSASWPFAA